MAPISTDARDALRDATMTDTTLTLPQVSPKVYAELKKVIERTGGRHWPHLRVRVRRATARRRLRLRKGTKMDHAREQARTALAEWEDRKAIAREVDARPPGACYCDAVGWCAVCDEKAAEQHGAS